MIVQTEIERMMDTPELTDLLIRKNQASVYMKISQDWRNCSYRSEIYATLLPILAPIQALAVTVGLPTSRQ